VQVLRARDAAAGERAARAKLSLAVDTAGALTVTLAELGTDNVVRRDGFVLTTK